MDKLKYKPNICKKQCGYGITKENNLIGKFLVCTKDNAHDPCRECYKHCAAYKEYYGGVR